MNGFTPLRALAKERHRRASRAQAQRYRIETFFEAKFSEELPGQGADPYVESQETPNSPNQDQQML